MNGELEAILSGEPAEDAHHGTITWPDKDQPPPQRAVLCRLCAEPCGDISLLLHFKSILDSTPTSALENLTDGTKSGEGMEVDNADLMLLISKTLPIKVSQSDPLPKQVCLKCVERLRESYSFVLSVINAESRLRSMADTKCFCASEIQSKDEESSKSSEVLPRPGLVRYTLPSGPKYCCPLCSCGVVEPSNDPPIAIAKKLVVPEKVLQKNNIAWDGTVIKMERDDIEPTPEELERSYRDLFQVRDWRTEKQSWPRSQPAGRRGYKGRPRGRPRGRTKMIPRGKRGAKRLTHTTVERILELSGSQTSNNNDVVRVRSGSDRLHADALTQCLLCEGWLPGMAACLQHSLANHTDCGAFLCPRCQQEDFPGEFELIQHFQEHHCPDLELCDGSDDDSDPSKKSTMAMESFDSDIPQTPSMYSGDTDLTSSQSRLSTRTGSLGQDVFERSAIEIKQNGDTNVLTLNSFLEDKAGQSFNDLTNVEFSQEMSIDAGIIPTEDPPVADEPVDPEDGEEDQEDTDEQDTKSDTRFDFRKDSEDPEGGSGNSSSGNANNLAEDSNSLENGDTSSHNTQPESKSDGYSNTDCGSNLQLARSLSDVRSKQKHKSIRKRGANFGRKPKRKRLCMSMLSILKKRKSTVLRKPRLREFTSKSTDFTSITEDISYPKSTKLLKKRITQTLAYPVWSAERRILA